MILPDEIKSEIQALPAAHDESGRLAKERAIQLSQQSQPGAYAEGGTPPFVRTTLFHGNNSGSGNTTTTNNDDNNNNDSVIDTIP